jgi:hypothetical protein
MSGSSGGFSPNPGRLGGTDCTRLAKELILSSPQPQVIRSLRQGEILEIDFDAPPGDKVIVAKTQRGQIAGSVTGEQRLRTCMIEGYRYVAEVLSVSGGACRVQIRYRS